MCYTPAMSATLAAAGFVLAYSLYKKRSKVCFLWALFAFYAGMELLQAVQYRTVNDCASNENRMLALVAFFYVLVQPFFWNLFAFKCRAPSQFQKGVFAAAMLLCIVMMVSFAMRLGNDTTHHSTDTYSGPLCTQKEGDSHLWWSWPIGGSTSMSANWFVYMMLWLVPMLFADGGLSTSAGLATGALLTWLMVRNKREFPATWCLFSIPFLILGWAVDMTA